MPVSAISPSIVQPPPVPSYFNLFSFKVQTTQSQFRGTNSRVCLAHELVVYVPKYQSGEGTTTSALNLNKVYPACDRFRGILHKARLTIDYWVDRLLRLLFVGLFRPLSRWYSRCSVMGEILISGWLCG